MADVKKLKDAIWYAKQELTVAQKNRDEFDEQLKTTKQMIADNPKNEELPPILEECEALLAEAEKRVAGEAEKVAALEAQLPEEFKPAAPKFDPEKHPLLKKTLEKAEPAQPVVLNPGDICEAFWPSDRSWYKAKIMTVLGSASNRKYVVKYVDYDETQTLDADRVRPIQQKRKREEHTATTTAATTNPHVISGPAIANPATQTGTQDATADDQPKKKKKVPSNKALERKVNNWKEWNSKGIGKKIQKESMFRTGTGVNSRVGFTGSGAGMTEAPNRVRHDNKLDERLDIEARPEGDSQPRYNEGSRRAEDDSRSRYAPPGRGNTSTPTHRRSRF